ncbi:MAG: hypothetical protein K6G30_06540, partial [Acetatifactor sp.]|nr:hypothetical protein [Acetatifactor sp.]
NVQYFITFMKDGVPVTGQSIMYSAAGKNLVDGDDAKIKYAFTKADNVQVMIDDSSLEASMATWTPYVKILWYIALPLLFIGLLTALI